MNEEICIITNGYPTLEEPVYAFIKPLANTMVDLGYKCTVIAPQSITNRLLNKKRDVHTSGLIGLKKVMK